MDCWDVKKNTKPFIRTIKNDNKDYLSDANKKEVFAICINFIAWWLKLNSASFEASHSTQWRWTSTITFGWVDSLASLFSSVLFCCLLLLFFSTIILVYHSKERKRVDKYIGGSFHNVPLIGLGKNVKVRIADNVEGKSCFHVDLGFDYCLHHRRKLVLCWS